MNNENDIEFKFTPKKDKRNNLKIKQNAFSILQEIKSIN